MKTLDKSGPLIGVSHRRIKSVAAPLGLFEQLEHAKVGESLALRSFAPKRR